MKLITLIAIFCLSCNAYPQTNEVISQKYVASANIAVLVDFDSSKPSTYAIVSCPSNYNEMLYCTRIIISSKESETSQIVVKKDKPVLVLMNSESVDKLYAVAKPVYYDNNTGSFKVASSYVNKNGDKNNE